MIGAEGLLRLVEEKATGKLIVDDNDSELPKMITSYITASSEDSMSLALDICIRAGASEGNAKEAVKALRKAFR